LKITPKGLVNGERNNSDGIVYFGNTETSTNDFSLPENVSGLGSKHFKIFYKSEEKEYYIQDLEESTGTFLQIERDYVIFIVSIRS